MQEHAGKRQAAVTPVPYNGETSGAKLYPYLVLVPCEESEQKQRGGAASGAGVVFFSAQGSGQAPHGLERYAFHGESHTEAFTLRAHGVFF